MDIAIIGGGAAGTICAHLLDGNHRVTLFEREPILGGNIRTLGGNVPCAQLDADIRLDAGVIEFSVENFPTFHRLLAELGVATRSVPATTRFVRADGVVYRSPGNVAMSSLPFVQRVAANMRRRMLVPELLRFRARVRAATPEDLSTRNFGSFLDSGPACEWLRLLMVYAYSIPRARIDDMPAALTIPTLMHFVDTNINWTTIRGGAYDYIDRIVRRLRGRVITGAHIEGVRRTQGRVVVRLANAEPLRFDKVVFATTPEQVLRLLEDPSDEERRRFGAWQAQEAIILIHDDDNICPRSARHDFSEFDVFEGPAGYNAYLNRLAGLPEGGSRHYHLSYNLRSLIDPTRIIHEQRHMTPDYTIDALLHRDEVIACNGERQTLIAGAWLGDGLHEGAACSAVAVSRLLGGRTL